MNMVEAGATYQRNMFSEIKITITLSDVTLRLCTVCDAIIKDGYRGEMSKSATLYGCTYNNEICLVCIEPIVCHPAKDITETVT